MALDVAIGRLTNIEIAEKYDLNPNGVSLIRSTPMFKELVREITRDITERAVQRTADLAGRLDSLAPKAVDTLEYLNTRAEMETVRLGAAKEILDRAPNAPKARKVVEQETRGIILQISAEAFQGMRDAAREAGGTLIDLPIIRMARGEDGFEFEDYFD
jgi:hypothetical protein